MNALIGKILAICLAAWIAMLALGSLGISVSFLPMVALAVAMWLVS